ncbi:transposase [Streptomyces sp. NPDC002994]|uniref:transposase n=1 Tax=Streptomyces sp. NPDC002994 TaxID=3154441 RepID=UPI0033A18CA8
MTVRQFVYGCPVEHLNWSSLWANRFWLGSYFAGPVGRAPLSIVRKYIENWNRPL